MPHSSGTFVPEESALATAPSLLPLPSPPPPILGKSLFFIASDVALIYVAFKGLFKRQLGKLYCWGNPNRRDNFFPCNRFSQGQFAYPGELLLVSKSKLFTDKSGKISMQSTLLLLNSITFSYRQVFFFSFSGITAYFDEILF